MIIKGKKFFAKGKRGFIYTGYLGRKKIVVKEKNPSSFALGRIKNEAEFLKLLNKYKIGPKLIKSSDKSIVYEFVKGEFILDFIEKNNKDKIMKILKEVLNQCFILDKLRINKLEMHHPVKHIIIDKKPVLIDFERCYYTKSPKNVTQFCQFLFSISDLLKEKKIILNKEKIIYLLKEYKKDYSKRINKIKKEIK